MYQLWWANGGQFHAPKLMRDSYLQKPKVPSNHGQNMGNSKLFSHYWNLAGFVEFQAC